MYKKIQKGFFPWLCLSSSPHPYMYVRACCPCSRAAHVFDMVSKPIEQLWGIKRTCWNKKEIHTL